MPPLGDVLATLEHVLWYVEILIQLLQVFLLFTHEISVKSDSPTARHDEVDLGNVSLLFKDVTVFRSRLVMPGHEPKCNLVNEVTLELRRDLEKRLESRLVSDVSEQELDHDFLLDRAWYRVEVLALFQQNRVAIILPKVLEVGFNSAFKFVRNVFATFERLVANVLNHGEPIDQLDLDRGLVIPKKLECNLDELIHQNGEDGNTHDFNVDTNNFLTDGARVIVTIAYSRERGQHEIHQSDDVLHDTLEMILVLGEITITESIHEIETFNIVRQEEALPPEGEAVPKQTEKVDRNYSD